MSYLEDESCCSICGNMDLEFDVITGIMYCDCCGAVSVMDACKPPIVRQSHDTPR